MTFIRFFLLMAVIVSACAGSESERAESAHKEAVPERLLPSGNIRLSVDDTRALGLKVVTVEEGEIPNVALRFGRVAPRVGAEAVIVAPFVGRVLHPPTVQTGDEVAAGQPLFSLAPVLGTVEKTTLDVQGADLGGQIEAGARELSTKETEAARARDLSASGIMSTEKVQQAETAVAALRAKLEALRRSLILQTRNVGRSLPLKAPFHGVIGSLSVTAGAVVQPGDVLARVLKPGPRLIEVTVPPTDEIGTQYEVQVGPQWLPGRLAARGAVVENDGSRHDRVELRDAAAGSLLPGMIVPVRVATGVSSGIIIPETAIVSTVEGDLVYVAVTQDTFVARLVRVGARLQGKVRIDSGLQTGERIVSVGAMGLRGEALRGVLQNEE